MCIYIIYPHLGDTMPSHTDEAHWHLSFPVSYDHFFFFYCKYPVYWFHRNGVHLLM